MQTTAPVVAAAIIGAGNIGRGHARGYREAGARIVAVCDVDQARATALAGDLQARPYSSVEEMLAQARPDVVSVCTPPSEHRAAACAAARRGIAVLCEKPLADTVEAGEAILVAAAEGGAPCMIGFCHRFHTPVLQIKEQLEAGAIGRPVLFRSRFAIHFAGVEQTWFAKRAISGGGTAMDASVHSLDLYRFLVGEITHVAAQLSTFLPGLEVEDNSVLLVNGPAGVPGVIEASWTSPVGQSVLAIYGTGGTLMVDYETSAFGVAYVQRAGEPAATALPGGGQDRIAAEIAHFIASVTAGRSPTPSGQDGLRALQIIATAYRVAGSAGCGAVPL